MVLETPDFSFWVEVPRLGAQDPRQLLVLKWCEPGVRQGILEQPFAFSLPLRCAVLGSVNPFLSTTPRAFAFSVWERSKLHCQNPKQIKMKQLIGENTRYKLLLKKRFQ